MTGDSVGSGGGSGAGTLRRLAWFAGLWITGVTVLAAVGYGIRFWLGL